MERLILILHFLHHEKRCKMQKMNGEKDLPVHWIKVPRSIQDLTQVRWMSNEGFRHIDWVDIKKKELEINPRRRSGKYVKTIVVYSSRTCQPLAEYIWSDGTNQWRLTLPTSIIRNTHEWRHVQDGRIIQNKERLRNESAARATPIMNENKCAMGLYHLEKHTGHHIYIFMD